MSVEYLGKVSANLTSNQLGVLVGLSVATNIDITWLKFKVDGKYLLVSDKHLGVNVSWNDLNSIGCVFGKEILIDKKRYKCRLLTGSDLNPNLEDNSEWKKLIVDFYSEINMLVNSTYTICRDSYYNSPETYCVLRGANSIESTGNTAKTSKSNNYGWRPVLELMDSFNINGVNENIGEIATFNKFNYAVTNLNGGNFNLTEKVDGKVCRTLNSQSNGEFTFNVEDFDSLIYGNHTIEIIVDDPTASGNVTVTSKFNKIKFPVQKIATGSNLKQVMLHNKELEKEISYQNYRLSEKLKEKNVEVVENESLSKLIDKVNISNFPVWFNGGVWINAEKLDISLRSLTSSVANDKIYVFGGSDGSNGTTCNKCYDPITNTWSKKNDMLSARYASTSSVVNGKAYVLGGSGGLTKSNQCYDPVLDSWVLKSPVPYTNDPIGPTSCAIDENIYCIGGRNGYSYYPYNYCYNTITDTWSTKKSMSISRSDLTSSVIDGKIYVIGGITEASSTSYHSANECYDPITNTWSTKANMPKGRTSLSSGVIDGKIYVIGGYNSASLNTNESYDPLTNTWSTEIGMPTPRHSFACSTIKNSLYTISGYSSATGNRNENECFCIL